MNLSKSMLNNTRLVVKKPEGIIVPNVELNASNTQSLVMITEKIPIISENGTVLLGHIISLLTCIPGLNYLSHTYTCSGFLDEGVNVTTDPSVWADYLTKLNATIVGNTMIKTKEEMICIGYCVLLMMAKSVPKNDKAKMLKYLNNRIKALTYHLGRSVDSHKIIECLDQEHLMQLSSKISHFPIFRKLAFFAITAATHGVTIHMREIFKYSSLTVFSFIHKFVNAYERTSLHVEPTILREIEIWNQAFKTLHLALGELWPFYKLIEPNGLLTSIKDYRNLAIAAVSWMSVQGNISSVNQIDGIRVNEGYKKLAMDILPAEPGLIASLLTDLKLQGGPFQVNWDAMIKHASEGGFDQLYK